MPLIEGRLCRRSAPRRGATVKARLSVAARGNPTRKRTAERRPRHAVGKAALRYVQGELGAMMPQQALRLNNASRATWRTPTSVDRG